MSFEEYAAFYDGFCGQQIIPLYGVTTNTSALYGTTCSQLLGPKYKCGVARSFQEQYSCSNGPQNLVNFMDVLPALTISLYSDANCGSVVQTIVTMTNQCTCLVSSDIGIYFNANFSISANGVVGVERCAIDDCIASSNNLTSKFPKTVSECAGQMPSVLGQCDKVSEECLHAFANRYNGFMLGSIKYDLAVREARVTKSNALSVGVSLVSFVVTLLMF